MTQTKEGPTADYLGRARHAGSFSCAAALPLAAAVLGQLAAMDGEHHVIADPDRLAHQGYSASLRSTSRSSRITRSATSIWAAKSGL
jgi:hypothetical protein